jgi:2-polyprenyl-3-methyl-5-hydroxy-6-metoxy-1,4-benzoquinol methylase
MEARLVHTSITRAEQVKSAFEVPDKYFARRQHDIRVRAETVEELTAGQSFSSVLDIGCGDGSISRNLLTRTGHLTLLDVSERMLHLASSRIPPDKHGMVTIINDNFMRRTLPEQQFDLIICIGVLAHVDDVASFSQKISRLLSPGGQLVLEYTDSRHFVGQLALLPYKLKPPEYALNLLDREKVLKITTACGLCLVRDFSYCSSLLTMDRWVPQPVLYSSVRAFFGTASHSRNSWLGNEHISLFKKVG